VTTTTTTTEIEKTKEAEQPGEQVAMAMHHAIGVVSDQLVEMAEEIGTRFDFSSKSADQKSKSALRNVLAVATSPSASRKVIQNFIWYQQGRSGASEFWKAKAGTETIAAALTTSIDQVVLLSDQVEDEVKRLVGKPLSESQKRSLRLRLIQLFLGYLVRHYAAVAQNR
jgi:hypothetical protein